MTVNPYSDASGTTKDAWARVHGNGEQTHVVLLSVGNDSHVAVAYDIDPRSFEPLAAEAIAYDPTIEGCRTRATRWMEEHPKGILGDGSGGGSGVVSKMVDGVKKLNEYGNDLAEQQAAEPPEKEGQS